MAVYACRISRPVTSEELKADWVGCEFTLSDTFPVSVHRNRILDAIMERSDCWETSPIVWVENQPYRISLLERTERHAVLLQVCLGVYYKKSGKENYFVINKRKVELSFAKCE